MEFALSLWWAVQKLFLVSLWHEAIRSSDWSDVLTRSCRAKILACKQPYTGNNVCVQAFLRSETPEATCQVVQVAWDWIDVDDPPQMSLLCLASPGHQSWAHAVDMTCYDHTPCFLIGSVQGLYLLSAASVVLGRPLLLPHFQRTALCRCWTTATHYRPAAAVLSWVCLILKFTAMAQLLCTQLGCTDKLVTGVGMVSCCSLPTATHHHHVISMT